MRAVQLHGVGDLQVDDLGALSAQPGQALIRVQACGVCPSEVRSYTGSRTASAYEHALPRVLGHEWAGVIEEIVPVEGADVVPGLQPGRLVAVDWRGVCGRCTFCSRGRADLCENMRSVVRGGFSDIGVAPLEQLYPFPDGVSAEAAAFTEPLACVVNGQERLGIELGSDLVVVGCGPMGLLHVQLGRARGARVIACDPIAQRADAALTLGAVGVVSAAGEEAREEVRRLTAGAGAGAGAVVVAVGAVGAVDDGIAMAGKTARVNVFAGTFPPKELALDPNRIHYPQISVTGTHDYTPHQFRLAGRLIARGVVSVAELISHRGGLEDTLAGFVRVSRHEGLKTMILPNS